LSRFYGPFFAIQDPNQRRFNSRSIAQYGAERSSSDTFRNVLEHTNQEERVVSKDKSDYLRLVRIPSERQGMPVQTMYRLPPEMVPFWLVHKRPSHPIAPVN